MSCSKSTSPIDITNNPSGTCDLKCNYRFKYNESTTTIKNKGNYLSFSYEKPNVDPVIYNSNAYYVEELRIYTPSLHKYSGVNSDAELIIVHASDYAGKLLVCIPIAQSEKDTSSLDTFILLASQFANKIGKNTFSTKTMNLNSMIPKKKMYAYKGTLPFDTCNGEHNIIVFNKKDDAYIPLSKINLNLLKSIITKHSVLTRKNTFYVNKKGPINSLGDTTGDIYIDCKPISEDDEKEGSNIIGDDDKNKMNNPFKDFLGNIDIKLTDKHGRPKWYVILLAIVVLLSVIYACMGIYFKYILKI
jgi:carbonic anhydrase